MQSFYPLSVDKAKLHFVKPKPCHQVPLVKQWYHLLCTRLVEEIRNGLAELKHRKYFRVLLFGFTFIPGRLCHIPIEKKNLFMHAEQNKIRLKVPGNQPASKPIKVCLSPSFTKVLIVAFQSCKYGPRGGGGERGTQWHCEGAARAAPAWLSVPRNASRTLRAA